MDHIAHQQAEAPCRKIMCRHVSFNDATSSRPLADLRRKRVIVMADLVGAQLGSCTIIRRLGGGGMGEIYLAEQRGLNRQVAVKVIRPLPSGDEAEQQAAAARFIREARAVAALEHPNILPIYEFGEVDGANYLVMPYIPDGSLADLMAAG